MKPRSLDSSVVADEYKRHKYSEVARNHGDKFWDYWTEGIGGQGKKPESEVYGVLFLIPSRINHKFVTTSLLSLVEY